ncbi:hypothetical protein NPIL_583301 [Nephila pilipes]|uniref:Uncharacterized protein n=1 Tax=Nephila pilipes TaxID=299642 RepID=A0A8X6IDI4_NEPPI|nr:hypothetical protein NPIL_583301 [Nephila pilipes]
MKVKCLFRPGRNSFFRMDNKDNLCYKWNNALRQFTVLGSQYSKRLSRKKILIQQGKLQNQILDITHKVGGEELSNLNGQDLQELFQEPMCTTLT